MSQQHCGYGLLLVLLIGAVQACNAVNVVQQEQARLQIKLVSLVHQQSPAGLIQTQATAITNIEVRAAWGEQIYTVRSNSQGIATFEHINASMAQPANILVNDQGVTTALLGVAQSYLEWPLWVTYNQASAVTTSITKLQTEYNHWTTSAVGQRSELFLGYRHRLGLRPPDDVAAQNDLYAQASYVSGSGQISCECVGDDCDDFFSTPTTGVQCVDPGGFAAGPSGMTIFVPQGQLELGFVERIVDNQSRAFVETGYLFYNGEFATGQTSYARFVANPRSQPDFVRCGGDGKASLLLSGLGREFAIAARGGIHVALGLRSNRGLYLPILQHERWNPLLVYTNSDGLLLRWGFPYPLSGITAGFSYEYQVQATSTRTDVLGVVYLDHVNAYATVPANDICQVSLPTYLAPSDFIQPTILTPLTPQAQDILWTGPTAPLRQVELLNAHGHVRLSVWLLANDLFRINLSERLFDGVSLAPGSYQLRLTIYPATLTVADLFLPVPAAKFYQVHPFVSQ